MSVRRKLFAISGFPRGKRRFIPFGDVILRRKITGRPTAAPTLRITVNNNLSDYKTSF